MKNSTEKENKKVYAINIDGTVTMDGEKKTISLYTLGQFYDVDGTHRIVYDESEATGFPNHVTTLEANSDRSVTITRRGEFATTMFVERGRRNVCHYALGEADVLLGVSGRGIDNKLKMNGGTLSFSYGIDIEASTVSENSITVTVKER